MLAGEPGTQSITSFWETAASKVGKEGGGKKVPNIIIDGSMNGSVITFDSEETPNSVLTGFTIRSGTLINGKRYGGGIYCGLHASPTIRHRWITRILVSSPIRLDRLRRILAE